MKNKIILIVILLIILGYSILFYYENKNHPSIEPFCSDCRVVPDLGSTNNIGNFIDNQQNQNNFINNLQNPNYNYGFTGNQLKAINNDDRHLSHTILSTRCTNVPVGVNDSSYIFCPFTNNCALPVYPGKAYSNNASAISEPCSVDNSCCHTDFHKNNYYLDDNGTRHPGLVFRVAIDKTQSIKSGINQSDISYSIMSYTPVTKDANGNYPNILGSHYYTTIADSQDLVIKSNTSDYIDCNGSLMSGFNGRKFPEYNNKTQLFDTPGKIWCLQAENQKYCKPNNDKILVPYESEQANIGGQTIKPYNNGSSDQYSLSNQNNNQNNNQNIYNNNINNPLPSNINFPSDNQSPLEMMIDYLLNVKTKNDKAICNRHKTYYSDSPKVLETVCQVNGYDAKPQM